MVTTLDTLPPELLLELLDYLAPSSHVSLTLVSKRIHSILPKCKLPPRPVGRGCQEVTIDRSLQEPELRRSEKRRCLVCGGIFDKNYFHGIAPVCKWHDGHFELPEIPRYIERPVKDRLMARTRLIASNGLGPCWVALERDVCFHGLQVMRWDALNSPCCECMNCGHFRVRCLVRVSCKIDPPRSWSVSKDGKWMFESDLASRK